MARRIARPGRSEFTGEVRNNTLPKMDATAPLDADQRLRLMYLTGTENVMADQDGHRSWNGWKKTPDSVIDLRDT